MNHHLVVFEFDNKKVPVNPYGKKEAQLKPLASYSVPNLKNVFVSGPVQEVAKAHTKDAPRSCTAVTFACTPSPSFEKLTLDAMQLTSPKKKFTYNCERLGKAVLVYHKVSSPKDLEAGPPKATKNLFTVFLESGMFEPR